MADRLILLAQEADGAGFTAVADKLINMVYGVLDVAVGTPGRFVTTA